MRRGGWGFVLGLIGTVAFYGAYAWIALATVAGRITLGADDDVRAGVQAGPVGGLGEPRGDRRHVRGQPLPVEPLRVPRARRSPCRHGTTRAGPSPATASASRTCRSPIPARSRRRSSDVDLHIRAGQQARAGRRERLGQDHADQAAHAPLRADRGPHHRSTASTSREWDADALRRRIGVIFQDFVRYQLTRRREHRRRRRARVRRRGALAERRREGHGRRRSSRSCRSATTRSSAAGSSSGRELSVGQWQKVALSRAFMRTRGRHPRARRADRRRWTPRPRRRSSSASAR